MPGREMRSAALFVLISLLPILLGEQEPEGHVVTKQVGLLHNLDQGCGKCGMEAHRESVLRCNDCILGIGGQDAVRKAVLSLRDLGEKGGGGEMTSEVEGDGATVSHDGHGLRRLLAGTVSSSSSSSSSSSGSSSSSSHSSSSSSSSLSR